MHITRKSLLTNKIHTCELNGTRKEMNDWESGLLIEEAFPKLTAWERDFIRWGVSKDEWHKVKGDKRWKFLAE